MVVCVDTDHGKQRTARPVSVSSVIFL